MNWKELWQRARPWHAVMVCQLLLQVASIALLSRWLGMQGYDHWLAGQVQCALLILLFSPGLEPWLVRRLAEAGSARKKRALIVRAGELMLVSHALILCLALVGGSFDLWPATGVVALLAASNGIDLARRLLVASRQAAEQHVGAALLDLRADLARIVGALLAAWLTRSPVGTAFGVFFATIVHAQFCLPALAHSGFALPWTKAARDLRLASPPLFSTLRDAFALACSKNATALGREVLPAVFLAHAGRSGDLALFRATARWVELPVRLLGGLSKVLLPSAVRSKSEEMQRFATRIGWQTALLMGGSAALFALVAPLVVGFLLGREVEGVLGVGLMLALGSACLGFGIGLDLLALARRALREQALANLIWLCLATLLGALTIASGGALAAAGTVAFFTAGVFAHYFAWVRRSARDADR